MSKPTTKFDPRKYITDLLVRHQNETEPLAKEVMQIVSQTPDVNDASLAETIHNHCDTKLLPIYQGDHRIACGEGCNHCCRFQVGLYAPEANRIREYIQTHFSEEQKRRVLLECLQYRLGNMCPLNQDGKCSVYEVRPITCRRCNGYEPDKCADFDPPEAPPFNKRIFALGAAYCAGLALSNVEHKLLVDFLIEILS